MITPEKIDEWLKEVEERPGSASLIVQYIANRLRSLTERNEELLAENIALVSGKRVEEYEQRIAHLEYQLDLLKRQLGGELPIQAAETLQAAQETLHLLIYNDLGQVLSLAIGADQLQDGAVLGRLQGELARNGEPVRLLVVPSSEELMLTFTSGRVQALPVQEIPFTTPRDGALDWSQAVIPDEPRALETLVSLLPISRLALADSFIQASRRGFIKKIKAALAQSILANHYIGTSTRQPADRSFEIILCNKDDRLALVSQGGYLLLLEVKNLPYSSEEAIRLDVKDHLEAAFALRAGQSLLIVTQVGKLVHRTLDGLSVASTLKTRGEAILSSQRKAQGVRVISAAAVSPEDWGAALHHDGTLSLHPVRELTGAGTVPGAVELAAFTFFNAPGGMK